MLKTVTVLGTLRNPDGSPAAHAEGTAKLTHYETDGGIVVPSVIPIQADENGEFAVPLWPNARGQAGSRYEISVRSGRLLLLNVYATVPDVEVPVHLGSILNQAPYPPIDASEAALLEVQAAGALALGYRDAAGLHAYSAGQSASDAHADAQSAGESRIAAQQAETDAGEHALAAGEAWSGAETARGLAVAARNAAQQHAQDASNDREAADSAALSAGNSATNAGNAADLAVEKAGEAGTAALSASESAAQAGNAASEAVAGVTANLADLATSLIRTQTIIVDNNAFS